MKIEELTLRDLFAAAALIGILASGEYREHPDRDAYAAADEMMKRREKKP